MTRLALIFPGQGSQYVGMGEKLCREFQEARATFEEANEALGFDLQKLCFEGGMEELTKTENTQPALLTISVAEFRVYMKEIGVEPLYCAGHSLGEISALTCSGAIGFTDAVKIVRQRGRFMQEAAGLGTGTMMAVSGLDKKLIEAECAAISNANGIVVVSNYNSPNQIVISGDRNAVDRAGEALKKAGATTIPLKVSAPFHSPLMQPAADKMREELSKYTFNSLKYPVISNVDALPYKGCESIVENLLNQIVYPVQWQASMEYLSGQQIEIAVEMGPKEVLKKLMGKNAPSIKAYSFDVEDDVKTIKKELVANASNDLKASRLNFIIRCLAIAVCTKNRNWNDEEYRAGVIEPYRKVQKMLEKLEHENAEPDEQHMQEAMDMLKSVFKAKLVHNDEQNERFEQLFAETGTRQLFS